MQVHGGEGYEQLRVADHAPAEAPPPYRGSRFREVWSVVQSDPYRALPEHVIGLREVLHLRTLVAIYRASRRTLYTPNDLLPPFDKPVHPLGICLRGRWRISAPTPYTGYFREGAEGLLIARASDNMGENRPARLRFLALAGKLYPTTDPDHAAPLRTANFVMNENLIGSHTKHFVDARLTTDLLPFRPHLDPRLKLPAGLLVASTFALADRATSITQALHRQLYPIAQLGEPASRPWRAPCVMRLVSDARNRRIETPDLREELAIRHHPEGIRYTIEVSDRRSILVPTRFRPIGEVVFTDSVASFSGDHRLHFHHPAFRHGHGRGAQ
jgi:hypothetical protein